MSVKSKLTEARKDFEALKRDLPTLTGALQRADEAITRARREGQGIDALAGLFARRDGLAALIREHERLIAEAEAEVQQLEREQNGQEAERERERRLAKHPTLLKEYQDAVSNLLATIRKELAKVLEAKDAATDNARRLKELGRTVSVPGLTTALEHPVSGEAALLAALDDFTDTRGFEITETERQRQAAERQRNRQRDAQRGAELRAARHALAAGDKTAMTEYLKRWGKGETPVPTEDGPPPQHYRVRSALR